MVKGFNHYYINYTSISNNTKLVLIGYGYSYIIDNDFIII